MQYLQLLCRPAAAFADISRAGHSPGHVMRAHLLPLSLIPPLAWGVGPMTPGAYDVASRSAASAVVMTWILCVASVVLLAAAFWTVMPQYGQGRDWKGAFAVAAYSATPVLLAGVFLAIPALMPALLAAGLHALALQHRGVQSILIISAEDAPEFVAVSNLLLLLSSSVLGAGLAAVGIL